MFKKKKALQRFTKCTCGNRETPRAMPCGEILSRVDVPANGQEESSKSSNKETTQYLSHRGGAVMNWGCFAVAGQNEVVCPAAKAGSESGLEQTYRTILKPLQML